jgi:hypothetical protein
MASTKERKAKARVRAALETAMIRALSTITVTDVHRWFAYCGYALQ